MSTTGGVLDRLPALATTGVGSLPFDAPAAAVRHATRAYDLPFVPQLPRRDGDMIAEWLGADWPARGVGCGWTSERDRARPAAWDAAIEALRAAVGSGSCPPRPRRPRAGRARSPVDGRPVTAGALRLVKLQATGPVTLAVALERSAGRPGAGRDVLALAGEIAAWLAANIREQADALADLGVDALVVVDEPGVADAGMTREDVTVWDPLRSSGAGWGLHVCCQVPWPIVAAAAPDVLSFDVTRYPVGGAGVAVLAGIVARGGRIAWGALDPVDPDGAEMVAARVVAGLGALSGAGIPVEAGLEASLLTPACGTGRLSVARERLVAATLTAGGELARSAVAARRDVTRAA